MHYLISSIIGYLLGSIPTAYLLLKSRKGLDITRSGSGNVGAMNSYEVTNSKSIGVIVLIIDALKGVLSVLVIGLIYSDSFILPAISLLFAVFSHCYNPWIGFRGGRGLATAAGGTLILFPFLLVVWVVLWVIFYLLKKDILIGNISATIFSIFLVFNTSDIAMKYANPRPESENDIIFFTICGLLIIFIRHMEPLKEIISRIKKSGVKNDKS
ncbi:MAG: glycerol-3-phosphate acyltransferase [Ignavibacteriaceae bacterium]